MNKELEALERIKDRYYISNSEQYKKDFETIETALKSYSKYKGKSVVIQCRKCGHLLYVDINDKLLKRLADIENIECPTCGEEGFENWVVRGVDDFKKRKIF